MTLVNKNYRMAQNKDLILYRMILRFNDDRIGVMKGDNAVDVSGTVRARKAKRPAARENGKGAGYL